MTALCQQDFRPIKKTKFEMMITVDKIRKLALAFEGAEEQPHFEKTSFRIKKKIFVTIDHENKRICLKLPPVEQSIFCGIGKDIIYPVPNAWGKQGWTFVNMRTVPVRIFADALTCSYRNAAPPKIAAKYSVQTDTK